MGRSEEFCGVVRACATDRGREGCHLFRKCKEIAGNIADRSKKRRLQNVDDTKNVKINAKIKEIREYTEVENIDSAYAEYGKTFEDTWNFEEKINVRMIAQGPEEINIILGIDTKDYDRTIRLIYDNLIR